MSDRQMLVDNLLAFLPLLHKKLIKTLPSFGITKQQLGLLFQINSEDGKLMSYYSEKMMVPKPNLTVMADKLIEEGLIERAFDKNDRRIIILRITDKGRVYLAEHKEMAKKEMSERLSAISETDITRLNELIQEIKAIFEKLD